MIVSIQWINENTLSDQPSLQYCKAVSSISAFDAAVLRAMELGARVGESSYTVCRFSLRSIAMKIDRTTSTMHEYVRFSKDLFRIVNENTLCSVGSLRQYSLNVT